VRLSTTKGDYERYIEEYTYYTKDNKEIRHGLHRRWYKDKDKDNIVKLSIGKDPRLSIKQLEYECTYRDGDIHGLCRGWYRNGDLKSTCYFMEGIKYESEEAYEEFKVMNRSW